MKDHQLSESLYRKALELDKMHVGANYSLATLYGEQENCKIVERLYKYMKGCQIQARRAKKWCKKKYTNWEYGAINHLKQSQTCPQINEYDFSVF